MDSRIGFSFLATLLIICFVTPCSYACTAFAIKHGDQVIFGENFDWYLDDGLIIVNKRHIKKTAWIHHADNQNIASWISQYGSVTFNHIGREFFHGGINEAGLFVTGLILQHSEYTPIDSRPAISQTQWKQYILDTCASVNEVIAAQSHIRIFYPSGRYSVHFFIGDKFGNTAAIEFIEGKMVVYTGVNMPMSVLTNSMYDDSVEYLRDRKEGGNQNTLSLFTSSLDRFARAAKMIEIYNPEKSGSAVDYGFSVLEGVAQGDYTVWSIVYDVKEMRIHFRTSSNTQNRFIDLRSFDFSCNTPVKVLNLNDETSGNVIKHFKDYSNHANRDFLNRVNRFYQFPTEIVNGLASVSENMVCTK